MPGQPIRPHPAPRRTVREIGVDLERRLPPPRRRRRRGGVRARRALAGALGARGAARVRWPDPEPLVDRAAPRHRCASAPRRRSRTSWPGGARRSTRTSSYPTWTLELRERPALDAGGTARRARDRRADALSQPLPALPRLQGRAPAVGGRPPARATDLRRCEGPPLHSLGALERIEAPRGRSELLVRDARRDRP